MKRFLFCLSVALLLACAGRGARACQYCQMAAAGDPEAAKLAAQVHGEAFPLEGVINQYAPVPPTASLSAPPPAASVVTQAADLPATVLRRATPPPPVPAPPHSAGASSLPQTVALSATPGASSSHWADAGLLGLAAAGGLFCWRTRRPTVSPS